MSKRSRCAHTTYVDKPLASHNVMQAIARVNRSYGETPGERGLNRAH